MDTVKGFKDVENASKRIAIRNIIENVFKLYGFIPVETPVIEYEKFVKGENASDEAVSDIFKLKDRGDRKLALRYEFTFQLKRLAKNKKLPYKVYNMGPVFRDEPVTGNRWRQFTQCDADIIGVNLKDVGEILKLTSEILKKLGVKFTININNRKLLNEILDSIGVKEKNRSEVIKEIDKIDRLSESEVKRNLKKYNADGIISIFKKPEKYFEKFKNYEDIKELKKICNFYKIKTEFSPFLARGLSYYNWIVFEIKGEMKESITAGGSYLVNGVQASGISFGLDRLELISKIGDDIKKVLVISLGQDKKAVEFADNIRSNNIPCEVFYGKPGKALDYANSNNIPLVVFVGDEEVKKKKFKLKNMNSGKEESVSEKGLIEILKVV
ncbi:MAG: ATP phosphoribosyltransferase regulatory subunit [archaeon]